METVTEATPEQKWSAIEYEYAMYFASKRRKCIEPERGYHCNAAVELQLLHARILADFLTRKIKTHPDDVLLGEVILKPPTELTNAIKTLDTEYGKQDDPKRPRGSINKRLAHLTNIRGDSFEHGPLLAILEGPLEAALRLVAETSEQESLLRICNSAALVKLDNAQLVTSTSFEGMDTDSPIPFLPGVFGHSSDADSGTDYVVTITNRHLDAWIPPESDMSGSEAQ